MKKALLITVLTLTFSPFAQAKANKSKPQIITGAKAIDIIGGTIIGSKTGPFEGDNQDGKGSCTVETVQRGHDLEVKLELDNHLLGSIEISETEKYKYTEQADGDGGSDTIESLDGRMKLVITQAGDAFDNVTASNGKVSLNCEADM